MKTYRFAMTLLAGAALMFSSCNVEEQNFEEVKFDEGEVAFRIASVQTRSAADSTPKNLEVATTTMDNGSLLVLTETVTSLDYVPESVETRGTPAFTENVKTLYKTFHTVALNKEGKAAFEKNSDVVNGVEYTNEQENIWHYRYGENIWGEGKLPTYFFMRMPGSMTENGVALAANSYNIEDGSISFSYTSPETASAQQDILFSSYKREGETNGEDITFYHALTGVKFANYFDNKESTTEGVTTTKTVIKSVTISGLKNTGNCTVTPSAGSSAAASIWNNLDGSSSFTQAYESTFADYTQSEHDLSALDSKATKRNLNDNDGSLTFWFIPQDLTKIEKKDSVTLTVVFDVYLGEKKTFENKELTVTLSDKLNASHKVWHAGELHTFTLRPTAVGVDITDTMDNDKFVKSDVRIENKGNVWEYVRVNLIGNWVGLVCEGEDENGNLIYPEDKDDNYSIVTGYPSNTMASGEYVDNLMVNPWNDKDFDANGNYRDDVANIFITPYTAYGTFVDLPSMGDKNGPGTIKNDWIRHDKYYYYMKPVGPGSAITADLFKSYTVGNSPAIYIADMWGTRRPVKNVHLEMDLAVQAIEAPMQADGVTPSKTYLEAWTAALNPDNDSSFNINDL